MSYLAFVNNWYYKTGTGLVFRIQLIPYSMYSFTDKTITIVNMINFNYIPKSATGYSLVLNKLLVSSAKYKIILELSRI